MKNKPQTKFIFIVGGVMSGVGKGVAAASIGKILQSRGFKVSSVKIDPYINVDAGTMNPTEHGEVFVTFDGDETDQDVGNYERFLNINIPSINYMTTGRVYQSVIQKERNLAYHGKCVEVVPHIPNEVIDRLKKAAQANNAEFLIVEIGGTIGEYQNILFLEAARMMKYEDPDNVAFILVSYLPIPSSLGEMKTKPTQYAVSSLHSAGISTDFIMCRSSQPIDDIRREKIAVFCSVKKDRIISAPDVESIYEVPIKFEEEKLSQKILQLFKMRARKTNLDNWRALIKKVKNPDLPKIKIGIVGKYFGTGDFILADSYISVIEAIKHAAWAKDVHPEIVWINSEDFEKPEANMQDLNQYAGIIVPGGFGNRGIEGKIKVIEFARINKIPYLGLCYGMQLMCVEFARNVCGFKDANTTEIDRKTAYPIIHIMPEQIKNLREKNFGASMRLGAYPCNIKSNTKSILSYKKDQIFERHRHRYEFNNDYREIIEKKGMLIAGISPNRKLVEIVEIADHPWMVGTQFHPEFQSRPLHPHPLFLGFIDAAKRK